MFSFSLPFLVDEKDKRIILKLNCGDYNDNELYISVSPQKIRVTTSYSADFEADTVLKDNPYYKFKEIKEKYVKHKEFYLYLRGLFKGVEKHRVEWINEYGKVVSVKYDFLRSEYVYSDEEYDELIFKWFKTIKDGSKYFNLYLQLKKNNKEGKHD